MPLFFTVLSLFGVLIGLYLLREGFGGDGLGATATVFVGLFVTIKEVMDMAFAK